MAYDRSPKRRAEARAQDDTRRRRGPIGSRILRASVGRQSASRDASYIEKCLWDMIKLPRAHGGRLGSQRRRRTWAAAKSSGEPLTGINPEISEWENPLATSQGPGNRWPTQGTETSKYLQEKKETSIPPVAASEEGKAQTEERKFRGVVGPATSEGIAVERHGKAGQRG